jgi:hypothetical protein
MQGTSDGTTGNGKVLRLMQDSSSVLLQSTKEFAVCYTAGNGTAQDNGWTYANIVIRTSRLSRLDIYDKRFRSCGTGDDATHGVVERPCVIPNHPELYIRYYGTIDQDKWVSFVDDTLNGGDPCSDPNEAAGYKDGGHSGSRHASGNLFTVDTAGLDATKTFAVCYSENGGIKSSLWRDSGLRMQRSAITSVEYGVDTDRLGTGVVYSAWNRNNDDNDLVPTDRLPRREGTTKIGYTGEVGASAFISLVDATLANGQPCSYPQIAGAAQDNFRTGPGRQASNSIVDLVFNSGNLLTLLWSPGVGMNVLKTYAVCYSTVDGTSTDYTWSDSYVRYSLSNLESISHHSTRHATPVGGQIPYEENMQFSFEGEMQSLFGTNRFALMMDQTPHSLVTNAKGFMSYDPCGSSYLTLVAPATSNFAGQAHSNFSGTVAADATDKLRFTMDTTQLHTGDIITMNGVETFATGDPMMAGTSGGFKTSNLGRPTHTFAVCYRDSPAGHTQTYLDSGIRVTVSKMLKINHGKNETAYSPYDFWPGTAADDLPTTGQYLARQVLPTSPNQVIQYFSTPLHGTPLGDDRYLSLVKSTINSNKPCLRSEDAGAAADIHHSGSRSPQHSHAGTQTVVIPQGIPLDDGETYAVCYAFTSGTTGDRSWHDSYIRLTVSDVEAIMSIGVTHKVNDYVATIASREDTSTFNTFYYKDGSASKLPIVYSGTIAASSWLSLVDETLGYLTNFPCSNDTVASGQSNHTGLAPVQAGTLNADTSSTVLFTTASLDYTKTYAVCYSQQSATSGFRDTGIRVKRSAVDSIQYHSGYANPRPREITSVEYETNRLPAATSDVYGNLDLSYVGVFDTTGAGTLQFTLVDATLNGGDPCVEDLTGQAADAQHTSAINVGDPRGSYDYCPPHLGHVNSPTCAQITSSEFTNAQIGDASAVAADTSFAVCYYADSGSGDVWRDSYIRLTFSKLAFLDHYVGRYTDSSYTYGRRIRHRTAGHLPSITAGQEGLDLFYVGPVDGSAPAISLVDAASNNVVENDATYQRPCALASAGLSASTTATGAMTLSSSVGEGCSSHKCGAVDTFASYNLDQQKVFALCYSEDSFSTHSQDTGIRFTISKIQALTFDGDDSDARTNTPLFLSTNRIPSWKNRQFTYTGHNDLLGMYVSFVADDENAGTASTDAAGTIDGTGNPCVTRTGASASATGTKSGVMQLGLKRSCITYGEKRLTAGTQIASSTISSWQLCRDSCEADSSCAQAVYNKATSTCTTASTNPGTEDNSDYSTTIDGASKWISASCSTTGTTNSVAMLPQTSAWLEAGLDYKKTYALCYTEYAADSTSAEAYNNEFTTNAATGASGADTDIWLDSYIRFRVSELAFLETSTINHWTYGQIPIIGTTVAYDYWDSAKAHRFIYHGEADAGKKIAFVDATLNSNYPCTSSEVTVAHGTDGAHSGLSDTTGANQMLDTTLMDTDLTFAICVTDTTNYYDSGIRVTVSKIRAVEFGSGVTGAVTVPAAATDTQSHHDAIDPRVMTTKAALTNRLPRVASQVLSIVESKVNGLSGTMYLSLVRSTLSGGRPCWSTDAAAPADAEHSGEIEASGSDVTIPQAVKLGSANPEMKFKVCYRGATGGWQDSYIILGMSDITEFKVHLPVYTGMKQTSNQEVDTTVTIRTVGQIPRQKDLQTTRYQVTGVLADSGGGYISLVDEKRNPVVDSASPGTNTHPISNSGFSRSDPCGALAHVDGSPTTWYDWRNTDLSGYNATHGTVDSNGYISNMDTSEIDPSNMYALCYSASGTVFYDSGIRITVPQVVGLQYDDVQQRDDRTREITSVTKTYNVLPLSSSVPLTYVSTPGQLAHKYAEKYISFVDHTLNNMNPCVHSTIAQQTSLVQADANKEFTQPAVSTGVMYAVCYTTASGDGDMTDAWIRARTGGSSAVESAWRDTYMRVYASEIESVISYKITSNIRGALPSHPALKVEYSGGLAAGARLALVDESKNPIQILGTAAATYTFPCSNEFGSNTDTPILNPASTACAIGSNCSHTGSLTASSKTVTIDTTDLHTQAMYVVCYNPHATDDTLWRDSGIRLTVPEINALTLDSGHVGTPHRVYKSWDTTDGTTLLDRPTSKLPAYNSITFGYVSHPSTPSSRAENAQLALVRVDNNARKNPCPEYDGTTHQATVVPTCSADDCTATGPINGGTSMELTVLQADNAKLYRAPGDGDAGTFAVCYLSGGANDGSISSDMYEDPNSHTTATSYIGNTVFWEDTFVRLKVSAVESLTASDVTHRTTGQVPSTAAESVTTWGDIVGRQSLYPFGFTYEVHNTYTLMAGNDYINLVDETLNPHGANGEGMPCIGTHAGFGATSETTSVSDGTSASDMQGLGGLVTGWNTMPLDPTKVYALCYATDTGLVGDTTWSDSGIRLTVPAVHAVLLDSGQTGPGNKEDTRARPMTSVLLPTNTFPRANSHELTYVGTLLENQYISFVDVSSSGTNNPCVDGSSHTAPSTGIDTADTTGPDQAGVASKKVTITQATNELLEGGHKWYAVCYDGSSTAPTFSHSPECSCDLETNAAARASCLSSCTTTLEADSGTTSSISWRDSYIRLKMTDIYKLKVHHGAHTDTSTRRTIDIMTAGGLPATPPVVTTDVLNARQHYPTSSDQIDGSWVLPGVPDGQVYNRQVGFEYVGSLQSHDGANGQVMLVDEERTYATEDNTNVAHRAPCSSSARLDVINTGTGTHTDEHSAKFGTKIIYDMVTDVLNTTKRFALCYSPENGNNQAEWYDSGLRFTISKVQSMHYLGDTPYDGTLALPQEQPLLSLRNRKMTSSKTALSVIPRAAGVKLRWDHWAAGWPDERTGSHMPEMLYMGRSISLVSMTLNNGNPCVNPTVASASATSSGTTNARLHSGVMSGTGYDGTGTGTWITIPQDSGTGTLLASTSQSNEYAVCYAEGAADDTDLSWRDSFIRIDTSDILSVSHFVQAEDGSYPDFGQSYRTTGHIANDAALRMIYTGELSQNGAYIALVDYGAHQSNQGVAELDNIYFPCGSQSSADPATTAGVLNSGALAATSGTVTVDTTTINRQRNGDVEVQLAVCYRSSNSGPWFDSAIRLTLTQVTEILYRSGYDRGTKYHTKTLTQGASGTDTSIDEGGDFDIQDNGAGNVYDWAWAIDTKKDTRAKHMDSSYSAQNRLPLHQNGVTPPTRYSQINYVTVEMSRMGDLYGRNKRVSFVAESLGTAWASPCDKYYTAGKSSASATSTASGYYGTASTMDKLFTFDSVLLVEDEKYALCYTDDFTTDNHDLNRWRDSYIRVRFSKLQSISALGVTHHIYGQIPNTHASDQLKVTYEGTLAESMYISLVDQTLNSNVPCADAFASTAADCVNVASCPGVNGKYSGVHQAERYTKTITTLDTTGLDPEKEFALCYSEDGSSWSDSGTRLTVPKIHTLTLPFDQQYSDPCRGGTADRTTGVDGDCTTSDRPMTSYPLATNKLPRIDGQLLDYVGYPNAANNYIIVIVDATLNNNNPCVEPSIPGTADVSNDFENGGSTANNERQLTAATQAVANRLTIPQPNSGPANKLAFTPSLGTQYTVCYTDGSGDDTDINWRDSYIRFKTSEVFSFGTKGVTHFTEGQIPHHRGADPQGYTRDGLEFHYTMDSLSFMNGYNRHYITLVKASPTYSAITSVDVTVALGSPDTVTFTGTSDQTPTAQSDVVVGNLIRIGEETRTVTYVNPGTTAATVSPPFLQAHTDSEFFVIDNTQRFDEGFANHAYNPCEYDNSDQFGVSTTTESIMRAQAINSGTDVGNEHTRTVNDFPTTSMIANQEYALCYSNTVGTANEWYDSGLRIEVTALSAIEYSGYKRGVNGFPTAYNIGYEDMGSGECTGTTVTDIYFYDSRMDEARCNAKCNLYTDCLAYSASSVAVPGYAVRDYHCKLWKATDASSEVSGSNTGAQWGNSHCMRKTSGSDEITRGKSHRKLQSVLANLQPHPEIAANVLPINTTIDLVYAGPLAKSSYISIVALNSTIGSKTTGMNPCRDASVPAAASSRSSGAKRSCISTGAGYVNADMYAQGGHECHPSGEVCPDVHGAIMATLFRSGCPNTDKNLIPPSLMETWDTAFASTVSQPSTAISSVSALCTTVSGGSGTWAEERACCGVDAENNNIQCTPTCTALTEIPDCSHSVDYEGNKEVSFSMQVALEPNADGYTVCYTDGDGSATDPGWRDSYIRFQLSKVTSIIATGVTHTDHGHLANHDDKVPLEIEYTGSATAPGYYISLVDETYNDNNPCTDSNYADGTSTADVSHFSVSSVGDLNHKVLMKTSHMDTTKQFAVCYNEGSAPWVDSGIRVRITEMTNIRYNEVQKGGPGSLNSVGMYIRDVTSSRVKIAPNSTYFVNEPAFYDGLQDSRDITSTHTLPTVFSGSLDLSYRGDMVQGSALALVEVTQNFGDPCVLGTTVAGPAGTGKYFYSSTPGIFYFDDTSGVYGTTVATTTGYNFSFSAAMIDSLDSSKTYTVCYDTRTSLGGGAHNPVEQNSLYEWYDTATIAQDWNLSPAYQDGIKGNFDGLGLPKKGWRDSYIRFTISRIEYATSHLMEHRVQGHIANAVDYDLSFKGTLPVGSNIALVDSTANSLVPCVASEAEQVPGSTYLPSSNDRSGPIQTVEFVDGATLGATTIPLNSNLLDTTLNYAICYSDGTTQSSGSRSVGVSGSTWYDSGIRVRVSKVVSLHYNREQQTEVATEVYMRTWLSTNKANGATNDYPVVTNRLPLVGSGNPTYDLQYRGFLPDGATFSMVHASAFIREPCASPFIAGHASDSEHFLATPATGADFTVDTSQYLEGMAYSTGNGGHSSSGALVAVCYLDESATNDMWKDSHIRLQTSKVHYIQSYGITHKTTGMLSNKDTLRVATTGTLAATGNYLALVEENLNNKRPCNPTEASKTPGGANAVTLYSGISTDNSGSNDAHTLDTSSLDTDKIFALCYAEGDSTSSDQTWEDSGIRLRTPKVTSITYTQPARVITSDSCFDGDLWGPADCNPSKTCSGSECTGGDPSVICATDATETCTVLPRHDGYNGTGNTLSFAGPDASGVTFVSFVRQDLGIQLNNPCRDARQASAAAASSGSPNQRLHSGPVATSGGTFVLPQLNDVGQYYTNLLQHNGTFAVCYTMGDGSDTDNQWRDSYIRITLSKIEYIQGSDMIITSRGMLANVPSLRVSWYGSLGWKKWINLVQVDSNGGIPCNKANAESFEQCAEGCEFDSSIALSGPHVDMAASDCKRRCQEESTCAAYTWTSGSCYLYGTNAYAGTEAHNQPNAYSGVLEAKLDQSGWLQAGSASEMVDFDTTSLTADVLYTVCYGDVNPSGTGTPSTGAPGADAVWTDSGIRLRFIKWTNPEKSRIASGAASLLSFSINHQDPNTGLFFDTANDYFALMLGQTDCLNAPHAPLLSDGRNAKRLASDNGDGTFGFAMPSGTGAAERATGWRQCHPMLYGPTRIDYNNYESCNEAGRYGDTNLQEGTYVMCFCDSNNGNSGCDQPNEWIKLSSSAVDPDMLKVVQTPRLGRAYNNFDLTSHKDSVRAISGASHTYNIKTTNTSGFEVKNADKVFFKSTFCDTIPTADSSSETAPILVSGLDEEATSGTYKAARIITPSVIPLTSLGSTPRDLVTCFATQESLSQPIELTGTLTGTCNTPTETCSCDPVTRTPVCSNGANTCTGHLCTGGADARDYAQLQDGLEIIDRPRLGTNDYGAPEGVIRTLSGNSPIFEAVSLKDGDRLFFKEMTTYTWQLTGTLGVGGDICDYSSAERCSCDGSGALSCSNPAHLCTGMSCSQDFAEGVDDDCLSGVIDVYGVITNAIPTANSASETTLIGGLGFQDGTKSTTTTFVVTMDVSGYTTPVDVVETADDVAMLASTNNIAELKYALDGTSRASIAASVGNTYIFDLDHMSNRGEPLVLSTKEGGEHNEGDVYQTGVTYYLDGAERSFQEYLLYFSSSTTRRVSFSPTVADIYYYHSYNTENLGGQMTVFWDDSGTFQLPTDVPLTSVSATVPRFLSACFIPAGTIETLHVGANCSYHNPTDATCTKDLINAHRLQDYLQVIPEPTDALKTSHNHSRIYNLNFNEPQFGTFWRTTNHWCESSDEINQPCGVRSTDRGFGDNSTDLCCVSPPNFASGAPDDVIVLKWEDTMGSGDCTGVELITDEDYLIGAQYTRKMKLSTMDSDYTTQSVAARPDLVNGATQTDYRTVAPKGAGLSHHSIADGKVNELPEGFYTICYATAESGADDSADFVKLSKSIEILPLSSTGPALAIPRTVLLGHNINVKWSSTSGLHEYPNEPHSWLGLFRSGECENDSGDGQNQCYLASHTLDTAVQTGEGTVTFTPTDYQLTAGTYEVRYFEGTSRDGQGAICRGLERTNRDSYVHCVLESVFTSSPIVVYTGINKMDDLKALPGLEAVFDGSLGRFAAKGAGMPGSDNDGFAPRKRI